MNRNSLILGWAVDELFEPIIWSRSENNVFPDIRPTDLIEIQTPDIATHLCLLAQSGAGKSYFLGRILEEILLATKSRLIILDPNGDFLKLYDIVKDSFWKPPLYDRKNRLGRLPTEASTAEFKSFMHSNINVFEILTDHKLKRKIKIVHNENYHIRYGELRQSFMYDPKLNIDEAQDLCLAHEFAKNVLYFHYMSKFAKNPIKPTSKVVVDWKVVSDYIGLNREDLRKKLRGKVVGTLSKRDIKYLEKACIAGAYVTPESWRKYDRIMTKYRLDGFVEASLRLGNLKPRIQIIDGTSTSNKEYRAIMNGHQLESALYDAHSEWSKALSKPIKNDKRVPTFIVIDEAHNIIPKGDCSSSEARCREKVREIAAEGRKYGLFLILSSQRPDKLDPLVLSEVENIALMRLGNKQILNETINSLGLHDYSTRTLEQVLQLPKSRALLLGTWTNNNPVFLMSAMRRSLEGGRNLNPDNWASPYI